MNEKPGDTLSADKRTEVLHDHYKDSGASLTDHWKARNRIFIFLLVLMAALLLDTHTPGSLDQIVNSYIAKSFPPTTSGGTPPQLNLAAIGSVAWFLLLCLTIQYYQKSVHVDRQYRYMEHLEGKLCELMGSDDVTREGRAYSSRRGVRKNDGDTKRPLFLRAVGPLYVYIFPVILSLFVLVRLYSDEGLPGYRPTAWFNWTVGFMIVGYNMLYVIWVKLRR